MSLNRLIYYSAIVGGWSAFLGWMISEFLLNRAGGDGGWVDVVLTCALVGGAIGMGLSLVAGMANARWTQQIKRVIPGLLAGGVGGAVGGLLGDILFTSFQLPRAFGWMIMGAGIGVVEGLYERSPAKLRNGLIGGAIGGLAGGFLFDPILALIGSNSARSSQATAFVILGMCIGILIGLVKVVLKEAWLSVLDGYRPGRQLILAEARTVLGRAEYATLPFMARGDTDVENEHARIVRQPGGRFALEDNQTRGGTYVNNVRVNGPVLLNDGDVIRLGRNSIRFSERHRSAGHSLQTPPITPPKPPPPATPWTPAATATASSPSPAPVARHPIPPAPPRPPEPAIAPPSRTWDVPAPKPPTPVAAPVPKPPTGAPAPAVRPAPAVAPPKPAAIPPRPPVPAASTSPATAPEGFNLCPSCKNVVPKGQRYCIRCDLDF